MNTEATYYESAEGVKISQARAMQEVKKHGVDVVEFFEDCGMKDEYLATEVLDWLGY
jgi:hypothetical protein